MGGGTCNLSTVATICDQAQVAWVQYSSLLAAALDRRHLRLECHQMRSRARITKDRAPALAQIGESCKRFGLI